MAIAEFALGITKHLMASAKMKMASAEAKLASAKHFMASAESKMASAKARMAILKSALASAEAPLAIAKAKMAGGRALRPRRHQPRIHVELPKSITRAILVLECWGGYQWPQPCHRPPENIESLGFSEIRSS